MKLLKRWKTALYGALGIGVIGFSAYGFYSTAAAYNDLGLSQNIGDNAVTEASVIKNSLTPGGTFCNPYGCAGCSGCVSLQYQQNVESTPSAAIQVEETY